MARTTALKVQSRQCGTSMSALGRFSTVLAVISAHVYIGAYPPSLQEVVSHVENSRYLTLSIRMSSLSLVR